MIGKDARRVEAVVREIKHYGAAFRNEEAFMTNLTKYAELSLQAKGVTRETLVPFWLPYPISFEIAAQRFESRVSKEMVRNLGRIAGEVVLFKAGRALVLPKIEEFGLGRSIIEQVGEGSHDMRNPDFEGGYFRQNPLVRAFNRMEDFFNYHSGRVLDYVASTWSAKFGEGRFYRTPELNRARDIRRRTEKARNDHQS